MWLYRNYKEMGIGLCKNKQTKLSNEITLIIYYSTTFGLNLDLHHVKYLNNYYYYDQLFSLITNYAV